jgi:transposase
MGEQAPSPDGIPADDRATIPCGVRASLTALIAEVCALHLRVNQASWNSSGPPSSDPPPRRQKILRGRPRGRQSSHPGQTRALLPPKQVDAVMPCQPMHDPDCQTPTADALPDARPVRRTQMYGLPVIRSHVTASQQRTICCPACQTLLVVSPPADAPPGKYGPLVTALIIVLHSTDQLSDWACQDLLAYVCDLPISLGSIATSCAQASAAVAPVDAAVLATVRAQDAANADEISCCASRPALHGRWTACTGLPDTQRQRCFAHLSRNVRGLADAGFGNPIRGRCRVLVQVGALFVAWHAFRDGATDRAGLQVALLPVQLAIWDLLVAGQRELWHRTQGFSTDLLARWEALGTPTRVTGVEPASNAAERALRPAVIWLMLSVGTPSTVGSRFVGRMLSVITTCRQPQRNVLTFLAEAVQAAWAGQPAPVLVMPG